MTDDPQDTAEAFDEDKVDEVEDYSGDEFGDALPQYPPDEPLGVDKFGVTPVEEDAGDSLETRARREEPDVGERPWDQLPGLRAEPDAEGNLVGQAIDPNASTEDHEEQAVADLLPGREPGPEAAAMHVDEEPG